MCEKVFLKQFRKKEVEGRKVVGIILFRKAGKRIYREMPLLLDNEGDEVFGETWRGAWVKVVEYPVQWNIEGASIA